MKLSESSPFAALIQERLCSLVALGTLIWQGFWGHYDAYEAFGVASVDVHLVASILTQQMWCCGWCSAGMFLGLTWLEGWQFPGVLRGFSSRG